MLLIGENLNVINTIIGKAFKEKDPGPIVEEALRQKEKAWTGSTSTWARQKRAVRS